VSAAAQRQFTSKEEVYHMPEMTRVASPVETGFTGWVEYIGRYGNRPAAYRLTQGGETLFFLRSGKIRLEDYNLKRVWLNGFSQTIPGASSNVLIVEDIRILGELRPSEMRKPSNRFPDEGPIPQPNAPIGGAEGPVTERIGMFVEEVGVPSKELPASITPNRLPMGRSPAIVAEEAVARPAVPGLPDYVSPSTPSVIGANAYAPSYAFPNAASGTAGTVISAASVDAPVTVTVTQPMVADPAVSIETGIPVRTPAVIPIAPSEIDGSVPLEEYTIPYPSSPLPGASPEDLPAYTGQ
jgi:hypothetical protein